MKTEYYLFLTLRTLCPLWLKFRAFRELRGETPEKKTKPIDKVNLNIGLTKDYEDQRMPGKKTNPICCSKALFLSEKSMIPSYIKYAKRTQLEIDSDVRN